RRVEGWFTTVRLVCTLSCRVAEIGIDWLRTWLSSTYSPVLMSCAALSTDAGFMWLPAPRSSVAPHFDGQRWLSVDGRQDGFWAAAVDRPSATTTARHTVQQRCLALPREKGHDPRRPGVPRP